MLLIFSDESTESDRPTSSLWTFTPTSKSPCLYEKAVEHAEWDVRNFGEQYGGLELLALARRTLEDLLESEPICHTGQGTTGHEED
ncbi:hypothetical protein D6C89_10599 [Aureobasidium pullulans]|nr:hypothetical protein D6C89_10599 [Aureobasidium pullulans]